MVAMETILSLSFPGGDKTFFAAEFIKQPGTKSPGC